MHAAGEKTAATPAHAGRFWLFAHFILLALVAIAWSAAWFVIRGRTAGALDGWIERERQAGRQWSCPDRSVGGFPFRIEVVCPSLALRRPDLTASIGRVTAVAQVYQPRHVIAEIEGPLRMAGGSTTVAGTWRLMQASFRSSGEAFQRASLSIEAPDIRITGLLPGEATLAGERIETHLRPSGAPGQDGAYDVSARAEAARLPFLDQLIGGVEPAALELRLTATQARSLAPSLAEELERWRLAGGILYVGQLSLAKGPRRIEARGVLRLDEQHRPAGRFEGSASGLEGVIGPLLGGPGGLGALLGALTGRRAAEAPPLAVAPGLKPLPPLRLENGRLSLGPVTVPGIRLQPLY